MTNDAAPSGSDSGGFSLPWIGKLIGQVAKVRLRGGVIGKLASVLMVSAAAIAIVSWSVQNVWVAGLGIGALFVLVLVFGLKMLSFAERNPYAANLEGAELLLHQQMQLGMKGRPRIQVEPLDATSELPAVPSLEVDEAEANRPEAIDVESQPALREERGNG